jgi:hypothetical protein
VWKWVYALRPETFELLATVIAHGRTL